MAVAIVILALLSLNNLYFALTPGPAENVLNLINIKGAKTHPVTGELLLTTVSLHEIRLVSAIAGLFRPNYQVLSRATIIPPGESLTDNEAIVTQEMSQSQAYAATAALRYLGYPVVTSPSGVRVEGVIDTAPAASVLRFGDVIVAADGSAVHRSADLKTLLGRLKVGDTVTLKVVRGAETIEVRTKTIVGPDGPAVPIVGIETSDVSDVHHLPLAIKINSLGIGGPSAGLMFAVGIVDLLNKSDIARGRIIAGTGEIGVNGEVKPIGGVEEKVAGAKNAHAQLFLVDRVDSAEACAVRGNLPVVSVATLAEAITVLTDPRAAAAHMCP